jgi:hypothetical protein
MAGRIRPVGKSNDLSGNLTHNLANKKCNVRKNGTKN